MIKKLIYLFCGTLVLTACGNSIEKKANEKLVIAKAAYERGDYEEAKTQIDSIKILYPKAFEARKAGQELMLDVELKAQQEILAFLDSALQAKQAAFDAIKGKYTLEKDAEYQHMAYTSHREESPSFLPSLPSERAGNYEHDFHLLRSRQYPSCRRQSDDSRRQFCRNSDFEGQLRNIGYERENRKSRLQIGRRR